MIIVYFIKPLPYYQTTLVDAVIMTILIFPVLYLFSFRPLIRQMEESWQAQDAIRQLSRIVEQTEDTVVVTDREGMIEYVNPAFERLTGYAAQEAMGKTPGILKSGLHNDQFFEKLWNTILGGEVFQSEIANRKKNGELFHEVKTITPLRDSQGKITHFVATGKDITEHKQDEEKLRRAYDELELRVQERTEELRIANSELEEEIMDRRRAEAALRESEIRSSRAEEIAHLGNWELDLVKNRLIWSDEVFRIFGLQPQEFAASYEAFLEAVHPDDRSAVDQAYAGSVRDGRDGYEIEHRVIRKSSGEVRVVHEKCEHFRNEAGQIIRSVGMVHDITERKRAEEALRLSEENFSKAFRSSPAALLITRLADGQFMELNDAYSSIVGYDRSELLGGRTTDFNIFIHSDDRQAIVDRLLTAKSIRGFDTSIRHRSGAIRHVVAAQELITFNGEVCILSSLEDITERKQAEEVVRAARDELEVRVQERTEALLKEIAEREEVERQLRTRTTAMEAAASGIVITDCQGNIQWVNSALTRISGYSPDELIGQSTNIFHSGQQEAAYYGQMWDTILSGDVWQGEMTNRRKDGSFYVEEQSITPVRDSQGQIAQFIAIKQDITERKQAEEALRKSEEKFRTLVEWTYDWEIWLDPSEAIVYHSPACERITGYSPQEFITIPDLMLSIVHRDDRAHYQDHQRLLHNESAGPDQMEYRILARDGQEHFIEHVCRPLFGADDRYLGRRISNRDITEQKQTEKAIEERKQKEKILTQTIHTMQLDIARDLHDTIGQNISFLRMKLDYLAEKKIRRKAEMQFELQSMVRAANESYDLMRGTLAVLQSSDSTDLFRLFTRYAEQIEERASFKISLSSQGEPRFMSARRMRHLFYVFREILNNIEKHARASQVTIEMVWGPDCLKLVVHDNGSGFDLDKVQYGSHYGLKFMKERVELLNGSLLIQSAAGSGTNIILQVPYE